MANLIGKQLGNYTLTQLLGQGGFAEVYLGEHVYLKTSAAIKVLLYPHLSLYEFCMFYMLLGFVASLAFLRTRGNYRSVGPIAFAVGTSFAGLALFVVGTNFAAQVHENVLLGYPRLNSNILFLIGQVVRNVTAQVTHIMGYVRSGLIGLVVLVMALLISNLFGKPSNAR